MLGDLFTLQERAQVQGLFSAVWGFRASAGRSSAGYLTDNLGWRWVFLVCVPFAMAAIVHAWSCYVTEPTVERTVAPIDWAGAVLLDGGPVDPAAGSCSTARAGELADRCRRCLGASVVLLVLFVIREQHAADPILPMDLMTRPMIAASLVGSLPVRRHPLRDRDVRAALHPGRARRRRHARPGWR